MGLFPNKTELFKKLKPESEKLPEIDMNDIPMPKPVEVPVEEPVNKSTITVPEEEPTVDEAGNYNPSNSTIEEYPDEEPNQSEPDELPDKSNDIEEPKSNDISQIITEFELRIRSLEQKMGRFEALAPKGIL